MSRTQVGALLVDRRRNASIAWVMVAFLGLAAIANLLDGDPLWSGFILGMVALVVVPPVVDRNVRTMLPWEILVMAALPVIGRTFATVPLTGRLSTYLSVAAVALVVAVELHAFTTVRMTYGFAVVFVVVATMATSGAWVLVRWGVEVALNVPALYPELGPDETLTAVNWEFVYSTVAGLVGAVVFELYLRRWSQVVARLPAEVEEFA